MPRKTPSRMELRKQVEAADAKKTATGAKAAPKKKKAAKKRATTKRAKAKTPARKVLLWGVFSASMKEEARFSYDQREEAEKKVEQLRQKSKKPFFIQPIKELLVETAAADDE